jgi:hypothetical protein
MGVRFTEHLRLEPIDARHGHDLWIIHNDADVAAGSGGWQPSLQGAEERARQWGREWKELGVHKWMAYERQTGDLVGRGGLSRTPADEDWGRICRFLPEEPSPAEVHEPRGSPRFTPTGSRLAGRCGGPTGAGAWPQRSDGPDWISPSATYGSDPWCVVPRSETCGLGPSWSGSACAASASLRTSTEAMT